MNFIYCEISETREGGYWIGLKDVVGDNNISSYRWVQDGSSLTYQRWANIYEPNVPTDKCVMRYDGGDWDDVSCTFQFAAICEADVSITV